MAMRYSNPHVRHLCLVSIAAAGFVTEAHAQPPQTPIVLEVYTGERPANADQAIGPIIDQLVSRNYRAGYIAVGRPFEDQVSRPAITNGLAKNYVEQVDKGFKQWIGGNFQEAINALEPLVQAADANPGAFALARDQSLVEALKKALIALALSREEIGDHPGAVERMGQLVRSFPDEKVSRADFGAKAFAMWDAERKRIGTANAKLTVKLSDMQGGVYVNERAAGIGTDVDVALAAGEYRVFAKLSSQQLSRSHRVVMRAGEPTTVSIFGAFDLAVRTTQQWTGLAFADQTDRENNEGTYARIFARAMGAPGVVIVGIGQVRGKPAVIGALINMSNGNDIRRASVALDAPPSQLKGLAAYIESGQAAEGVTVLPTETARPSDPKQQAEVHARPATGGDGGGAWGGWKYITGAGAVAGLGIGAVLLAYDGKCTTDIDPCPVQYNYAAPGWVAVGGGAALAAVTVYLFVKSKPARSGGAAFVVPARGGAVAGFTTRF
jgi:hypothetical protein